MPTQYLSELLAESRGAELRREASTARLATIATCCRPSAWTRAARGALEAVTQLRTAAGRDRAPVCCAV